MDDKMDDKVSVIIVTYENFKELLYAIESVRGQTHTDIEIIVVNDGSTDRAYYEHDFGDDVTMIHMEKNTKSFFGFTCSGGYQTNHGIKLATGKYIAFMNAKEYWLPDKVQKQLIAMTENDVKMSSCESYVGEGIYDKQQNYKRYNEDRFLTTIQNIHTKKNSCLMDNGYPLIWTPDFLKIHNCCINSSVIIEKSIVDMVGKFKISDYADDYDYWLRALQHTNCVYITEPLMYYNIKR